MTKSEIAKVAHEANRALCTAFGDTSQKPWEDAPEWQRASALKGVQLHIDDPHMPASSSHDAWCKDKRDHGWTYGLTKDPDAKTHPCLVPFDQLPGDQQAKDYVFEAIVRSLKQHLTD